MNAIYLYKSKHRTAGGPIPLGLKNYTKANGIDILYKGDEGKFDNYDKILWFNSNPPEIETEADIMWWVCDLRDPKMYPPKTTASKVFLCHREYDYSKHFDIPQTYCPQPGVYLEEEIVKTNYDIVFIGNSRTVYHRNRKPIISHLSNHFKIKWISGEGFTQSQCQIYKNTPISLSISPPAKHYTSNRTYQILISGGFCLILYFPGIEDLFENHKDLVWFKDKKDAVELAEYYLNHPVERQQIANEGQKLAIKKHQVRHRMKTIGI